jgi:hypothetical protein
MAIEQFCKNETKDAQSWFGKKAKYRWNLGRGSSRSVVNGVVRKLAGIGVDGKEIWTVAGSFKIDIDGTIIRFTGIPKKQQKLLSNIGAIKKEAAQKVYAIEETQIA